MHTREKWSFTSSSVHIRPDFARRPDRGSPPAHRDRSEVSGRHSGLMFVDARPRHRSRQTVTIDIPIQALARKGVTLPGPGTMKRISQIFADWGPDKVRTVGRNKEKRREFAI